MNQILRRGTVLRALSSPEHVERTLPRATATIRIGTWNVEHASTAKNVQRLELLKAANADIWVLTETQDGLNLNDGFNAVHSLPRPKKHPAARWVTLWSRFALIDRVPVRDPIRTVAALYDLPIGKLLVYGTVLPWHSDRGPTGVAPNWAEHHRVVAEQAEEWAAMRGHYGDAALCVAGDFNMNLGGRYSYGTREGKRLLEAGLSAAALACVTRTEHVPPGRLGRSHIDHVCLPLAWAERSRVVEAWPGTLDGVRLSDHSAIVVEVHG